MTIALIVVGSLFGYGLIGSCFGGYFHANRKVCEERHGDCSRKKIDDFACCPWHEVVTGAIWPLFVLIGTIVMVFYLPCKFLAWLSRDITQVVYERKTTP